MLKSMLVYQFERQAESKNKETKNEAKRLAGALAADIADWVCREEHPHPLRTLREFLGAAEFLGRRGDGNESDGGEENSKEAAE